MALAALCIMSASGAEAQDFPDTQRISSTVLFKRQQLNDERREAERRRVDNLDRQSQKQAILLQEQLATMKRLSGELQTLRDEREITKIADAFDVAMSTGRWTELTRLLAADVTLNLPGTKFAAGAVENSQNLIAAFSASPVRGIRRPRANEKVELGESYATLIYAGSNWISSSKDSSAPGIFEYRFRRNPDGWKLDGLSFKPATF